jgi:hypothetical protein
MADEMGERDKKPLEDENPLEEVAAQAGSAMGSRRVAVTGSNLGRVEAGQVQMTGSSALRVKGHAVRMESSAAGVVTGGSVEANRSGVVMAVARDLTLNEAGAPLVVAGQVKAETVRTVVMLAGQVQGNVQTVFSLWTALAAGVGAGVAFFGLRALSRRAAKGPTRTK